MAIGVPLEMRLTCLKCGHQFQVSVVDAQLEGYGYCLCGTEHVFPDVITPGIFPSDRAAEISRTRAFRAARVVKDIGGWSLKLTLFGIVGVGLAPLGALLGLYVVLGLPKAIRPYSGYRSALAAIGVGLFVSLAQFYIAQRVMIRSDAKDVTFARSTVEDELRRLHTLQTQFFETHGRYGGFAELNYAPQYGQQTIYLSLTDVSLANDERSREVRLPSKFVPYVDKASFKAFAVMDLDADPQADVWSLDHHGNIAHELDDLRDEL